MEYVMKSGMLYDRDQKRALARVKREFAGSERKILSAYRMPKVDHAHLRMDGREFKLAMKGGAGYTLSELSGKEVLRILHRGITGGWDIDAADRLRPETICGLFVFCRYMERENEIVIV